MEFLVDLWVPILVGTIILWICSFLAWVVLPHHFNDFKKLEAEEEVMQQVRNLKIAPGNYMFPYADSKADQGTKEFREKYEQGPMGTLNVYDNPNMGLNMAKTIGYFLVTVLTIAYITHVACDPADATTDFMRVFRVAGTIGVLVYGSSSICLRIWFKAKMWSDIVDGIVYGLVLGLIFAMLWKYPV
jgi:hypothetical protein